MRDNGIIKSWINEPSKLETLIDFLSWFDSTESLEGTVEKAKVDWEERMSNFSQFKSLSKKRCLEIGFGGGRLMHPASHSFEEVIGIDIHSSFDRTREFLGLQDVENYKLIKRSEAENLPDDSFDFIFSFIVFQHFDSFDEVDFYLNLIKRTIKKDGFAHIFFGKLNGQGVRTVEPKDFQNRQCSLFVEPNLFRQHLKDLGFIITSYEDIMPKRVREPLRRGNISGQARVLFQHK